MPAQLLPLTDGPSISLDKPILLLGRHPECDIQIDSRKVSRRHCCIAQVNDYLVVRDLDSTNGIRINGTRVQEGQLRPGDELTIGSFRYRVSWSELDRPLTPLRKEPAQPARVEAFDDDALESCDDPVPLPEPPGGYRHAPPVGTRLPSDASDSQATAIPQEADILPEDIHLAPSSHSHIDSGIQGSASHRN